MTGGTPVMSVIKVPPHIDAIFDQPGREWTPAERVMVIEWLLEDEQLQYLLNFTLRILSRTLRNTGLKVAPKHAEQVFWDYIGKLWQQDLEKYDPAEGRRFWNYLLKWLEYYCQTEGKKIILNSSQFIDNQVQTDEGEEIELEFRDSGLQPDEAFELKERREKVRKCVMALPADYRVVTILFYFAEMLVKDIAAMLGISEELVKVRLFRARHKLAECLRKEGLTL
jgi:RNA polymerase sigma factor (sigma-70 family)